MLALTSFWGDEVQSSQLYEHNTSVSYPQHSPCSPASFDYLSPESQSHTEGKGVHPVVVSSDNLLSAASFSWLISLKVSVVLKES